MALIVLCCTTGSAAGEVQTDPRLLEAQTAFEEAEKLLKEGKNDEALSQAAQSIKIREAVLGDSHLEVAASQSQLGRLYTLRSDFSRAELLIKQALATREASLGTQHPDVANSLNDLARLYANQGQYSRAEPLYERALAIQQVVLGAQHLDIAASLNNLANLYVNQGQYIRAEPLYERSLSIRQAALGSQHPFVADSLNNLAILYSDQGEYRRAEPFFERALALRQAALSPQHPFVADSLNNLANLYFQQGQYSRAEPLYERSLTLRKAAFGPQHPLVADSLDNLAILYDDQGQYSRAEPLYERALAIRQAAFGPQHPRVAGSLNNLALLYKNQGQYSRVEPFYERALAIRQAAFGTQHPDVAQSLNNLAHFYASQGQYSRAEPLYERALAIRQAALGTRHPNVAQSLNNLANLYLVQGQYSRAESLHERALAIREAALGTQHPDVAGSLNNLALIHVEQGQYSRAEPLYERALAIREAARGTQHPDVAGSLHNLAVLYTRQGQYRRAESLHERALAIREAALGKQHRDVARSLTDLASLYLEQGQYSRAEPLYERALAIQQATAPQHPVAAEILKHFAQLRLAQQQLPRALPLLTRMLGVSEQRLRLEALDFSESRLANFLLLLRAEEDFLYSLLHAYADDARVQHLALASALLRKGRSVEEISNTSRTVYLSLGEEDRHTFEQLRGLRTQLAALSHQNPGDLSPADYQQRLQSLAAQGDALETQLARRSAPLRTLSSLPAPAHIVERVATALPRDGALIEFVAYSHRPVVPSPGTSSSQVLSEPRYLAFVLLPNANIRAVDLGPAATIDQAASSFHDALASNAADWQGPAQALYDLAFRPLRPLLGKARHLFLSPDGQLNLVPFAALRDGTGPLLDSFLFTYLTSGKDLLPRPKDIPPSRSIVVFADPDFGSSPTPASDEQPQSTPPATRAHATERFFSSLRADLAERAWGSLPGTRQEAEAIHQLIPQAQLFLGEAASKQRLLQLPTPGVLHIATHGFFLQDSSTPEGARGLGHFGALSSAPSTEHLPDPLLRSGLVLAGASAQADRAPDSSLVTALELAGLDLWGTELVVLSACETGRGDVKQGQGVYGLRRALVAAGAETVVSSLWKVNDETTRELMQGYYRQLLKGAPRVTALHEAMLEARKVHPHPYAWAPFIALGRDAPLRSLAHLPTGAVR